MLPQVSRSEDSSWTIRQHLRRLLGQFIAEHACLLTKLSASCTGLLLAFSNPKLWVSSSNSWQSYSAPAGLCSEAAAERLKLHGQNALEGKMLLSTLVMVYRAVVEPFNGLMLIVAIVTACPPNSSIPTFALIMVRQLQYPFLQHGIAALA